MKLTRTKNIECLGKNPQNYENVHDETYVYEQKPIKTDDFTETEEKEVKEHVEKRKMKRREIEKKEKIGRKKKTEKKCGID